MGIFINTDLAAGEPAALANGNGGEEQRESPSDDAPLNRAALGNYIKSLGVLCSALPCSCAPAAHLFNCAFE